MATSSVVRKLEIKQVCSIINDCYDPINHVGVLLCEGEMDSIDVKLYSRVYPYLLVIPVGGCTDVIKIINSVRKRNSDIDIFGLIDRDANSKREIQQLRESKGVYCTKLPFIENIICTPEVIKIICRYKKIDYKDAMDEINEALLKSLTRRVKEALPVNVSISKDDLVESVSFTVVLRDGRIVTKTINEDSGLYAYRDKTIANFVADAIHVKGRHSYYDFFIELLDEPSISHDMLKAVRNYLPMIKA